ncbi:MAG: Rne/Rng family ribonuclease [Pseudomonadota bacterium]|nr:Rne/Rng family ribonuclease [Pseudomonadota bacterium]
MTKRMLIDGTHPEELRVVISNGNRLEEYDVETSTKSQLKGNIYLAKVTRVEPSLQAAFVDYGGNRHGFLAFSEIHPDYYQIPVEDREALKRDVAQFEANASEARAHIDEIDGGIDSEPENIRDFSEEQKTAEVNTEEPDNVIFTDGDNISNSESLGDRLDGDNEDNSTEEEKKNSKESSINSSEDDTSNDNEKPLRRENPMRRYKIQEVIKRRQILLIQVIKEERGNKGAALTTYLSLAGRYCVLMPNTARNSGGVSRKITNTNDRRRLRELLKNLNVPEGMGVIMRTAGMERNKSEIKRDFDYLIRLWENVRELTLKSAAPCLVYEEGDLIKRTIRDLYNKEIEEILVEGNDAYTAAKKLMRMMMPSHAKRVQPYRDEVIPLFHRYQVETQLESMHSPVVHLKSGGYIVINPTEALVAIDVNSGRSTRERNIEETAFKTNLEAASEVARQLRLRDLSGLIVIDFIDMDLSKNQRGVEKRLKEKVKTDRARIQLGRISNFGLFELSRQRMRPSIVENSTETCAHCSGTGYVRSTESTAVHVLRSIEEEGIRNRSTEVAVTVPTPIALYILNQKRGSLNQVEARYNFQVQIFGDDSLVPPDMNLERVKNKVATESEGDSEPTLTEASKNKETPELEDGKQEARARRPRRRKKKSPTKKSVRKKVTKTNTTVDKETENESLENNESSTNSGEGRPSRRRRRGRRGGRRGNQVETKSKSLSNNQMGTEAAEDKDTGLTNNSSDGNDDTKNTSLNEDSKSPKSKGLPEENFISTDKKSNNDSDLNKGENSVKSEPSPKRGWWQRMTE